MENIEERLIQSEKQKELCDKRLLTMEIVLVVISMLSLLSLALIASIVEMAEWARIVIILWALIIGLGGCFYALRIEQTTGFYVCRKCGHKHIPSYKQALFAMHVFRTRYIKCPKCGKCSWNKKTIK